MRKIPGKTGRRGATARIGGATRRIVSPTEWRRAPQAKDKREKAQMRAGERLAAARRRMPWMKIDKPYRFEGARGRAGLADLFEGRTQPILYHFMFGPRVEGWPEKGCVGCSFFADQMSHLDHIHARDITFVLVWKMPWYSSTDEFNRDCDVSDRTGNSFGLSAFFRDGADVYRTYFVSRRGVEAFGTAWSFHDLTPFGRQETWQDAPAGTPQGAPYEWWRRHGEYEAATGTPR